ncbi:carbohydrate ABC transporter permease [Paenibacillus filicis]|uniref:Carbohydrate ABC transporter permease n=1 Tax=Paenibacillus gyeongsangnamensis TaxID=3388067 RepID=A0ABT4Q2B7_9BACL|nr:carbohydrate ABC transporter permease [Paenibacillus filicis]MCZ8511016.1 carbohydrate ABC transporter permease [Paenibacillus filicis]
MSNKWLSGLLYALLSIGGVLMVLPFLWMLSTSLKSPSEVMVMPPKWLPAALNVTNYAKAWSMASFSQYLLNSVIVTVVSTIGELITTILAAFAFSRLRFYGRDLLFTILLGTMMVPGEVLLIPNYVTLSQLGWIDRYEALIVPWLASMFAIFLLRQYFLSIPVQLYYAARIDGSGDFKYLWNIMVPLAKPALVTVVLFKAIGSWNAFLWPLIVTNTKEMRTLPVGLTSFTTEAGTDYELLMAASAMIVVPMLLLYLVFERYLIEGISRGGLKG